MPLHLLPWIFLSPYLKTESLARLFATLDKSLISALSQHNAIDTLATFEGASEAWPAVMLFRSVQSVRCLEIAFVPSRGDPQNFSGLARLNPQELFFFDGDKRPNGSTPFFKRLALDRPNEHLTKGKHPRLATLFPALNSLRMGTAVSEDSYLLYNHQELNANFLPPLEFIAAMPSTLTVLHLDRVWHFGTSYEIYALPTSITDLHCDYIEKQDQRELFNISAALKHLQNLTRLTLIRVAYLGLEKDYKQLIREAYDGLMDDYEEEDYSDRLRKDESIPVTFPASLTDLTLKDYVESFPIELLTSPALASSSLTRLTVHGTISLTNPFALEENLQWADIMPSSLTHLDLIGTFDHRSASVRIKSLPTSLTELHFDFFELLDLAAPLLTPLRSLETLTFRTAVEAIAHWDLDWNKCDERTRRLNLTALPTMPLELLPASLKRLTLKRDAPQSLTLAELQRLPSNLDFLCLPRFDLSQLETLRKHLPKAFLEITQEIILTEPGNGALLRKLLAPSDVAPVLSLARVERAIRLWCNTNRVGFPLSLLPLVPYGHHPVKVSSNFAQTQKLVLDQKVMKAWPSDEGPNVFVRTMGVRLFNYNFFGTTSAMENAFPNAKTLEAHILRSRPVGGAALPPTLTTLDLHNTNFSIQLKELPFTLTRLTSNMPLEIARRQVIPFDSMSPRLKVLRTPKWEIDYFALLRIISPDMEVFEVTISGVADYNVIPLLERAISPHDLLVGRLCLKYACTGILVEDMDFEDGKADFAAIKAETTKTLMERLNSAIVPLPASLSLARDPDVWKKASGGWIPLRLALGPDFKFINERIGLITDITKHGLDDLGMAQLPYFEDRICEPPLESNPEIPYTEIPGAITNFGGTQYMTFTGPIVSHLNRLVHLEIHSNARAECWWDCLPSQLLTFIIRGSDPMENFGTKFPASLTALVIQRPEVPMLRNPTFSTLSFRMSALPKSLVHLALDLEPFELCDIITECKEDIVLPNMKSMFFSRPSELSALSLCRMLPKITGVRIIEIINSPKNVPDYTQKIAVLNCRQVGEAFGASSNAFAKLKIPKLDIKALLADIAETEASLTASSKSK